MAIWRKLLQSEKSYVIFICTFDPFGEGRHIYTFCNTCQENTSLTLNDDAVKIVLNTKGTIDDYNVPYKLKTGFHTNDCSKSYIFAVSLLRNSCFS